MIPVKIPSSIPSVVPPALPDDGSFNVGLSIATLATSVDSLLELAAPVSGCTGYFLFGIGITNLGGNWTEADPQTYARSDVGLTPSTEYIYAATLTKAGYRSWSESGTFTTPAV